MSDGEPAETDQPAPDESIGPSDLVQRAEAIVTDALLADWQTSQLRKRTRTHLHVAAVIAAAAIGSILLFWLAGIEVAWVASLILCVGAFFFSGRMLSAHKEDNLGLLLEQQAPVFGLQFQKNAPEFIRLFQPSLPGFSGYSGYQAGFQGTWRGVETAMAEILDPGDDEDAAEWALVIALAMKTRLRSPVTIEGDNGRILNAITRKFRGNRIEIDNAEFEERYEVFSDDDRRTKRLLSQDFTAKLMSLPRVDGDPPASFHFTESFMMLGYWSDNDIFPSFGLKGKTKREIDRFAKNNARSMSLPHQIISALALPPFADGLSNASGAAAARAKTDPYATESVSASKISGRG